MITIEEFEALRVEPAAFSHARHVELAWRYLGAFAPDEARERFAVALQRFAAHAGVPGKYDRRLTHAWIDRIEAERRPDESWEAFAARNAPLFDKRAIR